MDLSISNDQIMMQSMIQMKKQVDSVMQDAVSEANGENGNPLGASFEFSKPSELLSKLSQLQNSDPETFKKLMSDIAGKLQEAASEAGDDAIDGNVLGNIAEKFASVAETGDLSQLQPSQKGQGAMQGPPPSGGPGGGGGEGAGGAGGSGGAEGAGGAGGASSTSETSTCGTCGAEISENSTVCSQCGAVQDDTSALEIETDDESETTASGSSTDGEEETQAMDSGTNSSKISRYLLNASEKEKNSLLNMLAKLMEENDTVSNSGDASSETFSSIRDIIKSAFQQVAQNDEAGKG